jgi:hypothetical protein
MTKLNFNSLQKKKSVKDIYKNMESYVNMVIKGIQPSVLITGGPGTGKTFLVKKQLEAKGFRNGIEYIMVKGSSTTAGMVKALYENSGKVIVFDDCDSVFKDPEGVNILKAALDSYDTRTISYLSTRPIKTEHGEYVPTTFDFTGKIIFISNVSLGKIDSAVRSRSFAVDIELTPEQLLERMQHKLPEVEPKVPMETKREALTCLKQVYEKFDNVELNFRSLIKAIRIKQGEFPNWAMMVAEQCIDHSKISGKGKASSTVLDPIDTSIEPTKERLLGLKEAGYTWNAIQNAYKMHQTTRRKITRA